MMFLVFVTSSNGVPLGSTVGVVPIDNKCTWEFSMIHAMNKTAEAQRLGIHYHASCEPVKAVHQ